MSDAPTKPPAAPDANPDYLDTLRTRGPETAAEALAMVRGYSAHDREVAARLADVLEEAA